MSKEELENWCKCRIPSASSHHENCLECNSRIKTLYEEYKELEAKLTEALIESERNRQHFVDRNHDNAMIIQELITKLGTVIKPLEVFLAEARKEKCIWDIDFLREADLILKELRKLGKDDD